MAIANTDIIELAKGRTQTWRVLRIKKNAVNNSSGTITDKLHHVVPLARAETENKTGSKRKDFEYLEGLGRVSCLEGMTRQKEWRLT